MNKTRLLVIASVVVVLIAAAYLLPLAEWVSVLAQRARNTGPTGVLVFFVAYVVGAVAFLPGSLLTLAAGFAYGPVWGLAIASPASVAGATCAFLLGRTLLRDWAAKKVRNSARARAIDTAVEREGFKLVLLLRLSPLFPFNALNYLLSVTRVRTGTYVLASLIGMLPGTALYVYLGSLAPAAAELSSGVQGGGATRTILYVVGLVATVAVAVIATRAARRALDAQLQGSRS
jgi:uncharacterized membrane protein YdjX (TVP38/TMEM64 family)